MEAKHILTAFPILSLFFPTPLYSPSECGPPSKRVFYQEITCYKIIFPLLTTLSTYKVDDDKVMMMLNNSGLMGRF